MEKSLHTPGFFNAHAHCFTLDHVPEYFAKGIPFFGWIPISWYKKVGFLRWLVKVLPKCLPGNYDYLERLGNTLRFMMFDSQEKVIENMMKFYPQDTKFVLLTMDMSFMGAKMPQVDINEQLIELAKVKNKDKYKRRIFPFIFADPRRIDNDYDYLNTLTDFLSSNVYQGIKIYPALGYFPFDKGLKSVYDFALQNNIPIMTHCNQGVVHYRGKKQYTYHPIKTDALLEGKKKRHFTIHFTNPVNFECLLNPDILSKYWEVKKEEVEGYKNLKICFGHFGGCDEWLNFLNNPWVGDKGIQHSGFPSLEMKNWSFVYKEKDKKDENYYTWFSIIIELIKKYDNVWADISYMLNNKECFPILKVILESNQKIRERVLFGTDYYVVAKAGSERSLGFNIRGYLGEELFKQIAEINPVKYLDNNFS